MSEMGKGVGVGGGQEREARVSELGGGGGGGSREDGGTSATEESAKLVKHM